MANYTVARDKLAVHGKVLAADTPDTVTFAAGVDRVEVLADGDAPLYFTVDGSIPTVGGADCYLVPGAIASSLKVNSQAGPPVVKLISHGAPTYSVTRAPGIQERNLGS